MINIAGIIAGFATLFNPLNFGSMLLGFSLGLFFGAVPGLTATLAIALLLSFTIGMNVTQALVMVMGIYMAGMYGGSITATTINIPGAPGNVVTSLEGYPMTLKGEGAKALGLGALSSAFGGIVGVLLLMLIAPLVARAAVAITTPDKFSLILLALVLVSILQRGAVLKGIISTTVGLMIATVGMSVMQPAARFCFGITQLTQGVLLIPLIIGFFAFSELLIQAERGWKGLEIEEPKMRRRDFIIKPSELKKMLTGAIKGSLIGHFIGALPGAGASIASFLSYAEAKRSSKHPEKFGTGLPEGIVATETANNAVCSGALVPMLIFGIPGDSVTALVLGVLIIQGIRPSPALLGQRFYLVAPMYAALLVCAILIPIVLLIFGPYYMKVVRVNRPALYSFIAVIAMVGAYAATFSAFQMAMVVVMGILAYVFRKQGYSVIATMLGYILAPQLETYLTRSLVYSGGNPAIFFTSPVSVGFLVLIVVSVYFFVVRRQRGQLVDER